MAVDMSDTGGRGAGIPSTSATTKNDRPRSALGSAYDRIRQIVRPKKNQIELNDKRQTATPGPGKAVAVHDVYASCDKRRKVRKPEGTKVFVGTKACCNRYTTNTSRVQHHKQNEEDCRQRDTTKLKHPERQRAYLKNDISSSSSSTGSDRSTTTLPEDADLLFMRKKGIEIERKIGEGTYAQVHAGYHGELGRQVAVKILSLAKTNPRFRTKFLPRETDLLRRVDHPNIIHLYDTHQYDQKVFFVMELAQKGDLLGFVQREKALNNSVARHIFSQIVDGVEYLHTNGIYHRDLKCENILLDTGHRVKLTDFGFAREWYDPHNLCRTYCGSAAYASPEILQGQPYEPSTADMWSVGIVLYIMVLGKMPFDDSDVKRMVSLVLRYDIVFPNRRPLCQPLKTLIRSILNHGQWDRATLPEVKRNTWLQAPSC